MKCLFTELMEFVSQYDLKLTVTEQIEKLKKGTDVIVGGKIVSVHMDHFLPKNYYFIIDDGIGQCSVYVLGAIFQEFESIIVPGNIVLVKGKVARYSAGKDKLTFVVCTSIESFEDLKKDSETEPLNS